MPKNNPPTNEDYNDFIRHKNKPEKIQAVYLPSLEFSPQIRINLTITQYS